LSILASFTSLLIVPNFFNSIIGGPVQAFPPFIVFPCGNHFL
jgi:hypothetical protein